MRKSSGVTLVEILVVLSIVAVLAALAGPSFKTMVQSTTMSGNVNAFMSDLRFARSEAIRRGGGVVMCRTDTPESATAACGTGDGAAGNGWVSGWIVFYDANDDGSRVTAGASEPILRVQAPITNMDSIMETTGSGSSTKFRFTATGRLRNLNSATSLQFGGNTMFTNDVQRVVCVSLGGRARIAGNGTTSCGSSSQ